jgi:hypothetical protein
MNILRILLKRVQLSIKSIHWLLFDGSFIEVGMMVVLLKSTMMVVILILSHCGLWYVIMTYNFFL